MAISRTQMGTQLRGNRTMNNMRKYKSGGKLKMVEKGGKQVPFYAADGKGAMKKGGKVKAKKPRDGRIKKAKGRDGIAQRGKTRGRMR